MWYMTYQLWKQIVSWAPRKEENTPTGVLQPASVCNLAFPSYKLPDTFPPKQIPKTVLAMILSAASDRSPNSDCFKKRGKDPCAPQTEEFRSSFKCIASQDSFSFARRELLSSAFSVLLVAEHAEEICHNASPSTFSHLCQQGNLHR